MTKFPRELGKIYHDLSSLPMDIKFRFSVSQFTRLWYLAQPFHLINTSDIMDEQYKSYTYYTSVLSSGINSNLLFVQLYVNSTLSKIRENYFVFAWCYDVPDKDSILYYALDKKGRPGGIYGLNLNRPEQGETFIADSLSKILVWDVKAIRETIKNTNPKLIDLPKAKYKAEFLTYDKILDKNCYYRADAECVDDASDYIKVIQSFFLNTSGNQLRFDEIKASDAPNNKRLIQLKAGDKTWDWFLHNRDYIDPEIIRLFNTILIDLGITEKKFVAFYDEQWGQEMGIGFMNNKEHQLMKVSGYIK